MRIGLIVGAGALLAAGAVGVALVAAGDEDATPGSMPLPSPQPGPAPSPTSEAATGIAWEHDALLPAVHAGGAAQAEWAAEVLRHLDSTGDGTLAHADGVDAPSAWSRDTTHIVDALVARYDESGDGTIDASEATRIGADAASDGWLTQAAVEALRDELRA